MSRQSVALDRLQASRQRLAARLHGRRSAWPASAAMAADAGDALLRPLARKHPYALAAAAFAGGVALVALKPWQAVTGSALLSRLATQWASQLPLAAVLAAVQDAALSYMTAGSTPMPPAGTDA
jgi:hypothetical protein